MNLVDELCEELEREKRETFLATLLSGEIEPALQPKEKEDETYYVKGRITIEVFVIE